MSLTDKFDRNRRKPSGKFSTSSISEEVDGENYAKPGTIRNVCFVMLDGKREFFNYADLSRCSYDPELGQIILTFQGFCTVTLNGGNLYPLYERLQNQLPRKILCIDKRYKHLKEESETYVDEIVII